MIDHPRYEAAEVLGEGAQGSVVRVIDRERPHAKLVAKVLRTSAPEHRLAGEFALLSRLRIPGLVRVHDFARDAAGRPFFVEDLALGVDPLAAVKGRAPALARLVAELGETLAAIHDAGFVHGDVKPANVRVREDGDGRAMLLDLGAAIAARESDADIVHTPAFAAPEVRAGARPSRASDIYSLGATIWASATDVSPGRGALREVAPWVTPTLADAIDRALSAHPADRPATALELVAAAGRACARAAITWEGAGRGTHVREDDVQALARVERGVLYVVGPSGAGKSHVVREVVTRALLAGRPARLVRFPDADASFVAKLVAWLRGDRASRPFVDDGETLFVVLDDLHLASSELAEALDAFRCQRRTDATIVATAREAPAGATRLSLDALDATAFARLCEELEISPVDRSRVERTSGGLPGWAVAAAGRMPLAKDAVLARVAELATESRALVALVALLGGDVPADAIALDAAAPAFAAGLLERERESVRLVARALAADIAAALVDVDLVDRATTIALTRPDLPAAALAAIARAPFAPRDHVALLVATAERARGEEARTLEIEALLALVADPKERTLDRLARLERLTRDAGTARAHPRVLEWIEAAAPASALARRRRAEAHARAGEHSEAAKTAEDAVAGSSPNDVAYAHATRGAVALWSADWEVAAEAFERARSLLPTTSADEEEVARLEHNLGVVALYQGRHVEAAEAFERSMEIKRALGDRAGVRSCALNLGLARTKQRRFEESEAALEEALALAESLGQTAGRGWCLAARAELEVRRGRPHDAERFVAEAEALGDVVPKTVRADLALLRAEIALTESSGSAALHALTKIDAALRAEDALVDARCLVLESAARLLVLPVDRTRAARAAIAAVRRARSAALPDVEHEAMAAVRRARRVRDENEKEPSSMAGETDLWELLATFGEGSMAECAFGLARWLVARTRAERAFVIASGDRAWGADLDGLPIAEPEKRIDRESLAKARRGGEPVYLPDVARLAVSGVRSAVIVEHRFTKGAFDAVAPEEAKRWALLADLVARMDDAGARKQVVPAADESSSVLQAGMSTAMPRREVTREYPEIIGRSAALRRALAALDAAVDTDLPVLVQGETGTGKELFARALHDHGARNSGPFVAVNCAAIADSLFEAELFGHARGAFTGADRARGGLLARAEGGTLLLDEIGELSPMRQATLLRVLESKRYRPVGTDDERLFDVRIVAATNRDLDAAALEGTFRKDLLYRLRVLEVIVPPLRERLGDVEILFRHFLARAGSRATIAPKATEALATYPFPGNVRELLHQAQRLAASGVNRVDVAHLPRAVRNALADAPAGNDGDAERAEVERALERTAGNISQAAGLLGITRHGLKKRMLRLGLRAKGTAS